MYERSRLVPKGVEPVAIAATVSKKKLVPLVCFVLNEACIRPGPYATKEKRSRYGLSLREDDSVAQLDQIATVIKGYRDTLATGH